MLAQGASILIPLLPRRMVVALARGAGALGWRWSRRERRITLANLDLVYGESLTPPEKVAIGRRSFQTFCLTVLDLFWFARFTASRYGRYVDVDDRMREVLAQKPLVGVTGHFGNWEIINLTYGMEGQALTAVAMPMQNPFVDRILHRLRMRGGSEPVAREGAVRHLLRALRGRGAIGLVLDQNTLPQEGGVFVPFFGVPVAVSNAAGLLAVKTQSPFVVVVVYADAQGIYHFLVGDLVSPAGMTDADITACVTRQLEALIREHPEYWLWSYKRWRYCQAGDDVSRFPYYARKVPVV